MSPWCKNLKPLKVFDFAHDPNLMSNINLVFFLACQENLPCLATRRLDWCFYLSGKPFDKENTSTIFSLELSASQRSNNFCYLSLTMASFDDPP